MQLKICNSVKRRKECNAVNTVRKIIKRRIICSVDVMETLVYLTSQGVGNGHIAMHVCPVVRVMYSVSTQCLIY